jgi:uncharacterized protein (TIGR02453 family)
MRKPKKKAAVKIEAPPKFVGFAPDAMNFFRQLRNNNHRDWFLKKKDHYETTLLAPMRALVFEVADRLDDAGLPLAANRKFPVMRIYRDVRFSANKTPYKTAISAYLRRGGQGVHSGGVFLQFSDKERFVAMGFWLPERELLNAWRARIAAKPAEFQKVLAALHKHGHSLDGEGSLKRLPRGFDAHAKSPVAEYLKLNSFFVMQDVSQAQLRSAKLVDLILKFAASTRPLLDYGWKVEAGVPPSQTEHFE